MDGVAEGIRIFVVGLAQKTLIANTLALLADRDLRAAHRMVTAPVAWIGAIAYSLQIYFDFCGYSNMAIGLARVLGFTSPGTSTTPTSPVDHRVLAALAHQPVALVSRLRLHPAGRQSRRRRQTVRNLSSSSSSPASGTARPGRFVVWGLCHGLFLVLERFGLGGCWRGYPGRCPWLRPAGGDGRLGVVPLARFPPGADLLKIMAGLGHPGETTFGAAWFLTTDVVLAFIAAFIGSLPTLPWLTRHQARSRETAALPAFLVAGAEVVVPLGLLMLCTMVLALGTYNPFLYFRF